MKNTRITKAVVAAAGSGTRFLPTTLVVPKELIPLLDRPAIQWIVDELVDSGITDILFVINPSKESIRSYFGQHQIVENQLIAQGKDSLQKEVHRISSMARYHFINQEGPYGNGTPLLCAKEFVKDDPFVYVWPDDLVLSSSPFTASLVDRFEEVNAPVIGVDRVPMNEVYKYGVVSEDVNTHAVHDIIEKPSVNTAPSNLVQFGRMILTKDIIEAVECTKVGKGDELWLTDALLTFIKSGGKIYTKEVPEGGKWLTTGDPENLLRATISFALASSVYSKATRDSLSDYIS